MSKYHDDRSSASDPGRIWLSDQKLKRFHPSLYDERAANDPRRQRMRGVIEEHLQLGDSRAAVVLAVNQLLVAAYTDELDCAAVLQFPTGDLVAEHGLIIGARLLTVNTYSRNPPMARDLAHGSASYRRYNNFWPIIAEFVSEDSTRIDARKAQITEEEWRRAWVCGKDYLQRNGRKTRHGYPMLSQKPA